MAGRLTQNTEMGKDILSKFNEGKSAASFCHQVAISPFYELFLRQNPFAKILQTQIVSNEKLRKKTFIQKSCSKNGGEIDTRWQHGSRICFATFSW
jgi:hypothetical protein